MASIFFNLLGVAGAVSCIGFAVADHDTFALLGWATAAIYALAELVSSVREAR